jgi:GNAT superfamily N-acetyltransferase
MRACTEDDVSAMYEIINDAAQAYKGIFLRMSRYVRSRLRKSGIGTRLLRHLEGLTPKPILIGTWTAASWAIRFYEKNGYRLLSREEIERVLPRYWRIPARQIETSVVLASPRWRP